MLRLAESGPLARAWFGESRLQVRWADTESAAFLEQPAVRVLDAFTSGGAQQDGGRNATEIEWATNVDWARGRHAVRFGSLVEGGRYRSDNRTNYLGTFTFASLADYQAGIAVDLHPARSAIRWSTTRTGRPDSSCRTTGGRAGT